MERCCRGWGQPSDTLHAPRKGQFCRCSRSCSSSTSSALCYLPVAAFSPRQRDLHGPAHSENIPGQCLNVITTSQVPLFSKQLGSGIDFLCLFPSHQLPELQELSGPFLNTLWSIFNSIPTSLPWLCVQTPQGCHPRPHTPVCAPPALQPPAGKGTPACPGAPPAPGGAAGEPPALRPRDGAVPPRTFSLCRGAAPAAGQGDKAVPRWHCQLCACPSGGRVLSLPSCHQRKDAELVTIGGPPAHLVPPQQPRKALGVSQG